MGSPSRRFWCTSALTHPQLSNWVSPSQNLSLLDTSFAENIRGLWSLLGTIILSPSYLTILPPIFPPPPFLLLPSLVFLSSLSPLLPFILFFLLFLLAKEFSNLKQTERIQAGLSYHLFVLPPVPERVCRKYVTAGSAISSYSSSHLDLEISDEESQCCCLERDTAWSLPQTYSGKGAECYNYQKMFLWAMTKGNWGRDTLSHMCYCSNRRSSCCYHVNC